MPSRLSSQWLCGNWCTWAHDVQLHIAGTNEPKSAQKAKRLYYAPCLAFWALFGLLVQAMCNRTWCAHVHELSQSHCGDNRKDTLSHCFHDWIYISCKEKKLPRFKGSHQELSKYTMDDYPTVLLIKDNHESFPTYLSQTKNILNRETQGKVSLPGCVIWTDLSFFLKSCSQTKTFWILIFLSGLKVGACKPIRLFEIY